MSYVSIPMLAVELGMKSPSSIYWAATRGDIPSPEIIMNRKAYGPEAADKVRQFFNDRKEGK